jgi:hypothetical protein
MVYPFLVAPLFIFREFCGGSLTASQSISKLSNKEGTLSVVFDK